MVSAHDTLIAAEFLRLTLPLLAKFNLPATPMNYTVFYEFVAAENGGLKSAIDKVIAGGQTLDEAAVEDLYRRFIADWDSEQFEDARKHLFGLVDNIDVSVRSAGGDVTKYSESLQSSSQRLSHDLNADDLKDLVDRLSQDTDTVRASSGALQEQLEASQSEISTLRVELQRARVEAVTDSLTGLANRKGLEIAMENLFNEEAAQPLQHCLLLADIDRFKRVNDQYGHLLGDKVIKFVGSSMKQCVKGRDTVARFGGEEYAILLPETPLAGGICLAETVRKTIEAGKLVRSGTREPIGTITISIGAASYRPGESIEDLIARADQALYQAKNAGRNHVVGEGVLIATGTDG